MLCSLSIRPLGLERCQWGLTAFLSSHTTVSSRNWAHLFLSISIRLVLVQATAVSSGPKGEWIVVSIMSIFHEETQCFQSLPENQNCMIYLVLPRSPTICIVPWPSCWSSITPLLSCPTHLGNVHSFYSPLTLRSAVIGTLCHMTRILLSWEPSSTAKHSVLLFALLAKEYNFSMLKMANQKKISCVLFYSK